MAEQSPHRVTVRVPVSMLTLGVFSMTLIVAGILGLTAPALVPPLAAPAVAWSLIGSGAVMDVYAMIAIVTAVRRAQGRR